MRFFFANGGGPCYVVSAGTYQQGVNITTLKEGIDTLLNETEPTMLVVPDAIWLNEPDYYDLQRAMISHCGNTMRNRVAILDVYEGYKARTNDDTDVITRFREGIGSLFLDYAVAYYPWVKTNVVQAGELGLRNIINIDKLQDILTAELEMYGFSEPKKAALQDLIAGLTVISPGDETRLNQTLLTSFSSFGVVTGAMKEKLNLMPPSAALAGIYTRIDNSRGVWRAPANTGLDMVTMPAVNITDEGQQDLNIPADGKSINAIRLFQGNGVLIWGARTLDGNSQDWRYINVRRAMIYIGQSIKEALKAYVFEPNNSATWMAVKRMISVFLTEVWKQGGLAGATAESAFSVDVGLGTTMTGDDLLDGILRISVKVAITHPAEFILITFEQQMQKS